MPSHAGFTLDAPARHSGAPFAPPRRYRRREPERTLLHAAVREGLEPFLASARQHGSGSGLPAHVERALRGYLDCGILANGFARVRCPGCGFERLVAFSCKSRICPSCATRKMEDTAEHLVRSVLPPVPVRQWVLTLPRKLRFQAARDNAVASRLLDLFTRAVFCWQRRSARRTGVVDPRTGGVTFVQRFGGALNLNVHFHTLIPDGVFVVQAGAPPRFVHLPPPQNEDVQRLLARVIRRVRRSTQPSRRSTPPAPTTRSPRSRPPRSTGGSSTPSRSSTRGGRHTSTASRFTPACGCTSTTGRGSSGCAAMPLARRSRFTVCRKGPTAASCTG